MRMKKGRPCATLRSPLQWVCRISVDMSNISGYVEYQWVCRISVGMSNISGMAIIEERAYLPMLSMRSLTMPMGTWTSTTSPLCLLMRALAMGDLMEILRSRVFASCGLTIV